MKFKKMKRSLMLFLTLMLIFSNGFAVAASPLSKQEVEKPKQETKEKISKDDVEKQYKDTDKVRVIVEVEGSPAITYATSQGTKFSELDHSKQEELQNEALKTQQTVKDELDNKVSMDYKESFTIVYNGFSGMVEYGDIAAIEELSNVVDVTVSNEYERPIAEPTMEYSKDMIEAENAWKDFGYKGEGMVVGVIDSGIDPSHKDFVLTNPDDAAIVEDDLQNEDVPGKYFTPKVPYGYNYMDGNDEIRDLGPEASEHGMHVSGTVGANGDEDNEGIKGVAPEAQLLALKVFGNDPNMGSTWADIYIKAMDDAIDLGVDVMNMSLGSTAAFVDEDDPEQQAVENAVAHGVVMSISAGNSAHFGNGFFNPYTSNPDIGVVGSPGLSYDSLQVASIDNNFIDMDAVTYNFNDEEGNIGFMSAGNVDPADVDEKTFDLEYAGLGGEEDFEGKDFDGKYALIQRGEHEFTQKALNAQAAGAAGAIIYNNEDGIINMATDDEIVIPQLFMLKTDGDLLAEQLMDGTEVSLTFGDETVKAANPTGGQMSEFSSWGLTPNLDFKPEITAPGGNIYSTLQDDEYGVMSGTSMAAPHVSGGSAIVLERVDEDFNLENKDRVDMAKNIMMNTSKVVTDQGDAQEALEQENPYSPRSQGAGLLQLHAALSTPAVVTETKTGEPKVALKEVDDSFSFTLEAKNMTDESVTYDLDANVQTDFAFNGLIGNAYLTGELDNLEAQELLDAKVTINNGNDTVKVPANGSVYISVDVDLSDAKVLSDNGEGLASPEEVFENGYFVEGFVTLTDPNDNNPELSVPYVGFHGDWNDAPVLDELDYDGNDSFYEEAAMVSEGEDDFYYLGHNPIDGEKYTDQIAISPNGDGEYDNIIPVLSYLRNAKTVEYNILDENKDELKKLQSENNIRKNFFDGGASGALPYRLNSDIKWDGTVNGDVVEDGQYYFEIVTTIDYPDKDAQKMQVPVYVDTTPPTVEATLEGSTLSVETSDATSGVSYYQVRVDGEFLDEIYDPETTEVDLGDALSDKSEVAVQAVDNAGNSVISGVGDEDGPTIEVHLPDTFEIFSESEVYVLGLVTDKTGVANVTVEGQEAELSDLGGGQYVFEADVEFDDGAHPINIIATDKNGNETKLSNSRTIFVDTTAPELDVNAPTYVEHGTSKVEIESTISDNAEELRLKINDSEVYYNEMPGYEMTPFSDTVKSEVSLEPGENVFTLELEDLAGNTATEEVTIYRALEDEERASRIAGSDRFKTAVEVSQKGWDSSDVVVLSRWDEYADALAGVPLAKQHDAPLLLTQTDKFTEATKDEIERLGAQTVYVLGGEQAVGKEVVAELKDMGVSVERIAGDNRTETAALIADEVTGGTSSEVVLVNGYDFPDALAVASYAANEELPILLTQDEKLSKATEKAMYDLDTTKTLVVGGPVAVSEKVANKVPKAFRVAGDDRFGTSVALAEYFDVDTNHYNVTTGMLFPDALSGAALAAKEGSGILLVHDKLPKSVSDYVAKQGFDTLTIFGGPDAVNTDIQKQLNDLLK